METKNKLQSRCKCDADFKKEVIKMVESGRKVTDIAQSLGIGTNLIYQWLKRARMQSNTPDNSSVLSFDEEKATLQKRIRELEMERDILKKSLGHLQPLDATQMYEYIHSEEGNFPCCKLCETLEVSRSGYYAWRQGKTHQPNPTKRKMEQKIIDTFHQHKRRYGSRRISKTLADQG
ncbi:MAG: transposase [Thermoflavifilum aggregans]|nr:transposase [Thermoflavifilum aggregans]